jgi:hypothetical protein
MSSLFSLHPQIKIKALPTPDDNQTSLSFKPNPMPTKFHLLNPKTRIKYIGSNNAIEISIDLIGMTLKIKLI